MRKYFGSSGMKVMPGRYQVTYLLRGIVMAGSLPVTVAYN